MTFANAEAPRSMARDGKVVIDEQVVSMPKWLLLFADGHGWISSSTALGPASPTCAPT